jgi:hypothetical protein
MSRARLGTLIPESQCCGPRPASDVLTKRLRDHYDHDPKFLTDSGKEGVATGQMRTDFPEMRLSVAFVIVALMAVPPGGMWSRDISLPNYTPQLWARDR